jgi:hypothetical protein
LLKIKLRKRRNDKKLKLEKDGKSDKKKGKVKKLKKKWKKCQNLIETSKHSNN